MTHLLDTNACVTHLRSRGGSGISARIRAAAPGAIAVSSVTREELLFGALRSKAVSHNLGSVRSLLSALIEIPFDAMAAESSAAIRASLEQAGTRIGYADALIAGVAITHNLILVTHNVAEFARIGGLRLEDWETP